MQPEYTCTVSNRAVVIFFGVAIITCSRKTMTPLLFVNATGPSSVVVVVANLVQDSLRWMPQVRHQGRRAKRISVRKQ